MFVQVFQGQVSAADRARAAQMSEMDTLSVGEPEFFDLTEPWLSSRG